MKVYLVLQKFNEETEVLKAFSTQAKAEAYADSLDLEFTEVYCVVEEMLVE